MPSRLFRALRCAVLASVLGALAGTTALIITFTRHPDFSWELDRPLPQITSGFYPIERNGDETFAWSGRVATISMQGLDREQPWQCSVRLRGARPPGIAQPIVTIGVDGVTLAKHDADGEYADLEVPVATRPSRRGATLTIASSEIFVPGPADRRELGVQVDRVSCRPAGVGFARAPRSAIRTAGLTGAFFGAAFGLMELSFLAAIGMTTLVAVAQAFPLSIGTAIYSSYLDVPIPLAFWIVAPIVLALFILQWRRRKPLHQTARLATAVSAAVLFIKLLVLLHPSKLLVDALFHAHRLEWVMSGRFYFTQPMPSGVQFPYAIGLYLFAWPWSGLTRDYVALLRIVVTASEACAALLLYPAIVATWRDRGAALAAVVLFHLIPVSYVVVGNANLTFAFAQSAAVVTMGAAAAWPLGTRDIGQWAGLFAVSSLTFLSHVGTFPQTFAALMAVAVMYRWPGGSSLRAPARAVFLATVAAAVFSVVSYYGHFAEVYKSLQRVSAPSAQSVVGPDDKGGETSGDSGGPSIAAPARGRSSTGAEAVPLRDRAVRAWTIAIRNIGWPIWMLALVGAWRIWIAGGRDRLDLTLAAWGIAYVAFLAFALLVPVDLPFQRYADEYVGRVNYGFAPAAVILAARGSMWAWRTGILTRMAAAALWIVAAVRAVQSIGLWLG